MFQHLIDLLLDDHRCPNPKTARSHKSNKFTSATIEVQLDFFYPNACQVCGKLGKLSRCSKCQMISYCGKEHQTVHWKSHKYFCNHLLNARKHNNFLRNAKGRKQESWTNAKLSCISDISKKLGRNLTLYEQKVIKFTRACVVCHDIEQKNLTNCPNCASVSVCTNHKDIVKQIHEQKCPDFKLCYTLDLEAFIEKSKQIDSEIASEQEDATWEKSGLTISRIPSAPMNMVPCINKIPDSTANFVQLSHYRLYENMRRKEFEIADLFAKPLSLLRALQVLELTHKTELTIHLIDGNLDDLNTYSFWETLFHLLPNLKSLKVVLANLTFAKQSLNPRLCKNCSDSDKELVFETIGLKYHRFTDEKSFSLPDIAIGFLIELRNDSLAIKSIERLKVPLAFTDNLEKSASNNHKYVEKVFGKCVRYSTFERNPLCGVKPILDFKTENCQYEHQFLTIYKSLEKQELLEESNKRRKN